tara:strand:+ start:380 stop:742 length:363 start_codon:yes stop_codon:yes gene_type:complete
MGKETEKPLSLFWGELSRLNSPLFVWRTMLRKVTEEVPFPGSYCGIQDGQKLPELESGCQHHEDCFTCPFPDCLVGTRRPARAVKRRGAIREMKARGHSKKEICKHFGVCYRTVQKALQC